MLVYKYDPVTHHIRKDMAMGLIILGIVLLLIGVVVGGFVYFANDGGSEGFVMSIIVTVIGGALASLVFAGVWATAYRHEHWATCHVTNKDRGGDEGSYRIYTSNCGVLADEDSLFRAKYNSADIWNRIPQQGDIRLQIVGSRWPFLSQFPNVIDAQPVNS